jgi:serine/threonine protein kinase
MPATPNDARPRSEATQDAGDRLPSAFSEGSIVDGKYAIEATIAEGGLGVIVRATHLGLGQNVAIKYLKPRALANAAVVERFEREARLSVQIASEHVVHVQDVGNLGEAGPYIVMEYLVGRDLGSIVEEGPLPIVRAVDYVLQACDALAEAHALRIVHRDIKPENMFLAQRPSNTAILKIIDFGISKAPPKRGERGSWAHETGRHERFGTPLYMSPEQLRSPADVDQRADIWGLGAVLFELVTGEAVFDAIDMPELCANILGGEPKSLRALVPDAPEALERAILKCLQKDRELRFRNVAELAQELEPFGTASAASRVTRIKQVVRRSGYSIRPTPAAFPAQRVPIASDSAVTTQPDLTRATMPRRWPWRPMGMAAIAGVAFCGVIGLVTLSRASGGTPASEAASLGAWASASTVASAIAQVPVVAAAQDTPVEPVASSDSISLTGLVAPPAAQATRRGGSRAPAAAASTPKDPRAAFGERK